MDEGCTHLLQNGKKFRRPLHRSWKINDSKRKGVVLGKGVRSAKKNRFNRTFSMRLVLF